MYAGWNKASKTMYVYTHTHRCIHMHTDTHRHRQTDRWQNCSELKFCAKY